MIKNRHANCFHLEFIRFNFPNPKIKIFKKLKFIQFILKNYLKKVHLFNMELHIHHPHHFHYLHYYLLHFYYFFAVVKCLEVLSFDERILWLLLLHMFCLYFFYEKCRQLVGILLGLLGHPLHKHFKKQISF